MDHAPPIAIPRVTIVDRSVGWLHDPLARTKVAVIGAGPSRHTAPWTDPTWLIYGLNEIPQPRADVWFELHPMAKQNPQELAWLARQAAPVYLLTLDDLVATGLEGIDYLVPNGVRYPLERVLQRTGARRYFTCTFAFQIALALAEGAEEIGVYGVDLDLGTTRERLVEKPCVEYWLGVADGMGVRVTLPESTTLLQRPYLYGYEYDEELADIKQVCEDALAGRGQPWWTEALDKLGFRYSGTREAAMVRVAELLGRVD